MMRTIDGNKKLLKISDNEQEENYENLQNIVTIEKNVSETWAILNPDYYNILSTLKIWHSYDAMGPKAKKCVRGSVRFWVQFVLFLTHHE